MVWVHNVVNKLQTFIWYQVEHVFVFLICLFSFCTVCILYCWTCYYFAIKKYVWVLSSYLKEVIVPHKFGEECCPVHSEIFYCDIFHHCGVILLVVSQKNKPHYLSFFVTCCFGSLTTFLFHTIKPTYVIPTKPLHNHDIVSVHFNHFYCTEIYDKLSRNLALFTYIYLNWWLTFSCLNMFKLQLLLNYAVILENVISKD